MDSDASRLLVPALPAACRAPLAGVGHGLGAEDTLACLGTGAGHTRAVGQDAVGGLSVRPPYWSLVRAAGIAVFQVNSWEGCGS